jgi:hypothetical protein
MLLDTASLPSLDGSRVKILPLPVSSITCRVGDLSPQWQVIMTPASRLVRQVLNCFLPRGLIIVIGSSSSSSSTPMPIVIYDYQHKRIHQYLHQYHRVYRIPCTYHLSFTYLQHHPFGARHAAAYLKTTGSLATHQSDWRHATSNENHNLAFATAQNIFSASKVIVFATPNRLVIEIMTTQSQHFHQG